jgi:hypothetical protein
MNKNKPMEISDAEWREIIQVPEVSEGWGLEKDETIEDFKSMVYGVKFDFMSGSPGYFGDLYIIQGDSLEAPIVLIRRDGKLQPTRD